MSMIGVSITPHSLISIEPVSSPAPFSTAGAAAIGRAKSVPGSSGTIAVTPVRAIGSPDAGSPCHTVTWPTPTPGTSVIALSAPVGRSPNVSPIDRGRGRGAGGVMTPRL
ncbi:MAG: hypothetical protein FD127_97 [Acidimicrobiaceae bacterium]|nr:MAG: hypothetical protein FD127_97 [Acidimicrobiaceae bacterium]